MHLATTSFGNLGRLADLEKILEPLDAIKKRKEVATFVETLQPNELKEFVPKVSEEVLGILFSLYRDRVKEAIDAMSDPFRKGKKLLQIATSLQKKDEQMAHSLLSECISFAREAIRNSPEDSHASRDSHILIAQVFGTKGNISGAILEIKKALNISGDAVGYTEMSKMLVRRNKKGDRERARESLQKAIELNPAFQPAYLELSRTYEAEGELDQAIEILRPWDNNPDTRSGIYNELGTLYKKKYDLHDEKKSKGLEKINALRERLGEDSPDFKELIQLFDELYDRYQFPKGLPHEKKSGELLPHRREKNAKRIAELQIQIASLKNAPCFSDAPEAVKKLVEAYEDSIRIFQESAEQHESNAIHAIRFYQQAINHPKPYPPAHLNLGRVYFFMGRMQMALKHHHLAVEAGVSVARYFLGRLYFLDTEHKDHAKAKDLLEVFIKKAVAYEDDECSARLLADAKETLTKLSV
jgi:tetratricopeptide (TPR) repeat protein